MTASRVRWWWSESTRMLCAVELRALVFCAVFLLWSFLTELQTCCDASSHQAWTQSNSRVRHQCHKSCLTGGSSSARPGFQARRHEVGSHSQGVHADDHTVVSHHSFFSSESNILICPPQQTSCVCVTRMDALRRRVFSR